MDLTVADLASTPTGVSVAYTGAGDVMARAYPLTGFRGAIAPVYTAVVPGGVGPVSFPLPAGSYLVMGFSQTDPDVQSPLYQVAVTNGQEAVATRSRAVIADTIRSLNLPLNVYEQWNTTDLSNVMYPCAILSVENVQETREKSLNATDDIGRPVKVSLCDRAATTDHTKLPLWEKWRERIERRFHNQQLDMPESYIARVEYNSILDPSLPKVQFCLSEFVIRHITREYRG